MLAILQIPRDPSTVLGGAPLPHLGGIRLCVNDWRVWGWQVDTEATKTPLKEKRETPAHLSDRDDTGREALTEEKGQEERPAGASSSTQEGTGKPERGQQKAQVMGRDMKADDVFRACTGSAQ